jgi:alpha 1,3-glucosidase
LHRPQFVVYPEDAKGFAVESQFWIGSSGLLVRPAVVKDVNEVDVYLAGDQVRAPASDLHVE